MAISKDKKDVVLSSTKLPELSLLLINDQNKIKVISLDTYPDEDKIKELYLLNIEKYGAINVRYCKVVSTNIVTDIKFI